MLKTWSCNALKCVLLVPQDIDFQPALNCFPISKSCVQNLTFIINETDLCEGSGLERHAKTLALQSQADTGDRSLVLLPRHERLSVTSESTSALISSLDADSYHCVSHKSQRTATSESRSICQVMVIKIRKPWGNFRLPHIHHWLAAEQSAPDYCQTVFYYFFKWPHLEQNIHSADGYTDEHSK